MQAYNERLSAPTAWWGFAVLGGLIGGIIFLPVGPAAAGVAVLVAAVLIGVGVNAYGAPRIRVTGDELLAGKARVPLSALGEATALDQEEARALRMERADPRAFMLLRSYVPTAARVEVTDPEDPTPYLYLSTRNPARFVEVLDAVRKHRSAQPDAG
ncbi:DUF3093 domain-containing protein [Yinghuangia seranimata]|uniref:DUF3093 domain-containing protein n=1 Tax=Yinghuangia seranimata TaxID=408067 RepID=UPI00248CE1E1|nr:DUF3093 domain-containing protein [Yinghuangia seranimata]MDI2128712.1 DUF3093 domain-containing protein [Yinghuangia seranimata]